MGRILEGLKKYFKNTPKKKLEKDWEEVKDLNEISPDVSEYFKFYKK